MNPKMNEKGFKTIIAGSRIFTDGKIFDKVMKLVPFPISNVISGGAAGADSLGEKWGNENKLPVIVYPADWDKYGKAAGPIRNKEMALEGDALVAFLDIKGSTGTKNMIETWKKLDKGPYVIASFKRTIPQTIIGNLVMNRDPIFELYGITVSGEWKNINETI